MKQNWLKWLLAGLTLMAVYFGSYCTMSVGGRYEAESYGVKFDESGKAKVTPKKLSKGPSWYPFDVYTIEGSLTYSSMIYLPLLMLDRLFWHNASYANLEHKS